MVIDRLFNRCYGYLFGTSIENEDDIVVTAWMPHWMFAKYDLTLLEDPMGVFGDAEEIHTIVRQGLKEDQQICLQHY